MTKYEIMQEREKPLAPSGRGADARGLGLVGLGAPAAWACGLQRPHPEPSHDSANGTIPKIGKKALNL